MSTLLQIYVILIALDPAGPDPKTQSDPLQLLLQKLESDSPSERTCGASALGATGSRSNQVLAALKKCLKDNDREVRTASALSLLELGEANDASLGVLVKVLKDKSLSFEQVKAYSWLGSFGARSKPVLPILIELLKDPNQDPEWPMLTLCFIGAEAKPAAEVLIPYLRDPIPKRRRYAAMAVGEIGPPAKAAVPVLQAMLKEEDKEDKLLRLHAAGALIRIVPEEKEAIHFLQETLSSGPSISRIFALGFIRDAGSLASSFVTDLCQILKNKVKDRREHEMAARALRSICFPADQRAIKALKDALQNPEATVRIEAATSLLKLQPEYRWELVPVLVDALKNQDSDARTPAAKLLGEIGAGAKSATSDLKKLLGDKWPATAIAAALALSRVEPADKESISTLTEFLKHQDQLINLTPIVAANALGEIGPRAKSAQPVLLELLGSHEIGVCRAAAAALVRIQTKP